MLLYMKDIRIEQREEQHIIFLIKIEVGHKENNATLKIILAPIMYNGQMLHQNIYQI